MSKVTGAVEGDRSVPETRRRKDPVVVFAHWRRYCDAADVVPELLTPVLVEGSAAVEVTTWPLVVVLGGSTALLLNVAWLLVVDVEAVVLVVPVEVDGGHGVALVEVAVLEFVFVLTVFVFVFVLTLLVLVFEFVLALLFVLVFVFEFVFDASVEGYHPPNQLPTLLRPLVSPPDTLVEVSVAHGAATVASTNDVLAVSEPHPLPVSHPKHASAGWAYVPMTAASRAS
ncbi:hypothetical protein BBJ28_00000844 [Nothophytophthora sp. Chile5]|nr:hypothetical protein BBJ28_00000844 [Nothophytophthora sp. Chile5]